MVGEELAQRARRIEELYSGDFSLEARAFRELVGTVAKETGDTLLMGITRPETIIAASSRLTAIRTTRQSATEIS